MKASDPIETRVGIAIPGDNIFFGYSVAKELAGAHSYASLIALAVSGKKLDPELVPVLDDIAAVLSVADPRLWPMKTVRIISAYGNTMPAVAAGQLIFQSDLLGPRTASAAAALLLELDKTLQRETDDDQTIDRFVTAKLRSGARLSGIGVPFRDVDERLVTLRSCLEQRKRAQLRFWVLLERLAGVLSQKSKRLRPNFSLALAAALLDLGFEEPEIALIALGLQLHLCLAVAWEGAQSPAPQLRRLPVESVRYVGKPPRLSPKAQRVDQAG